MFVCALRTWVVVCIIPLSSQEVTGLELARVEGDGCEAVWVELLLEVCDGLLVDELVQLGLVGRHSEGQRCAAEAGKCEHCRPDAERAACHCAAEREGDCCCSEALVSLFAW